MDNISNKTAVFIDYENINITDSYSLLFKKLIKEGYNPCIRKIICSTIPKKANFVDIIKDNLLDIIVSCKPLKKGTSKIIKEKNLNNADFKLYTEALRILYTNKDVNTYVIATSDDDYYELIVSIKKEGKYVIGVGNKATTNSSFKDLFDKFYYIEDLSNENDKKLTVEEVKNNTTIINKNNITKTNNNEKKEAPKQKKKIVQPKKEKDNKKEYKKDKIFYSVLKNAISEELNTAKTKNEDSYFISNLISKIKNDLPYLKNYNKITKTDIEKCGYKIEYENNEKVKGYIKTQ